MGAATTILELLAALANHDKRTRGHAERVRVYTDLLAQQMRLSSADQDLLRWAALAARHRQADCRPGHSQQARESPRNASGRSCARIPSRALARPPTCCVAR